MRLDSLVNRGDYFSAHYLAEVLPKELKKKDGTFARWTELEKQYRRERAETGVAKQAQGPTPRSEEQAESSEVAESSPTAAMFATPRQGLRALGKPYFADRPYFAELDDRRRDGEFPTAAESAELHKRLHELHGDVLRALGFQAQPRELRVERAGSEYTVAVAYADEHLVAIECGWAVDVDAALDEDQAGRLLTPVALEGREEIVTGSKLAKWLFAVYKPPRYVLLLAGSVVILADRGAWGEARFLGVSLDMALGRNDIEELGAIGALFGAESLLPPAEGGSEPLAELLTKSRNHAVGVSKELRDGLRDSVELISNEVLARLHAAGVRPEDIMEPAALARELGREALRYLYRILFLLYAEARPELGILPTGEPDYISGYSLTRLGELIWRDLGGEESRRSLHLYESLDLLFRLVNDGHRQRTGVEMSESKVSEEEGLRFEPMRSELFEPKAIGLISENLTIDDEGNTVDTRLRNACLYQVLRKLMLAKGRRKERGGFISYAQLGINQLGAVYEGLMSYTGFIATEDLLEVAKGGDPKDGSWMIPASKENEYSADVFVRRVDEDGVKTGEYMRYPAGSFVYRLAGRDRETSASYYTPESLTSVTVQLALKYRLDQDDTTTTAREILGWKICEPALGSGAFLNEAIKQVAAEYLKRREKELGAEIDPEQRDFELQKAKAYIALHNSYGVDLNATAVELAEVSLWLNVMHPGLQAPWFGLHLRRGNSLIGASRKVYDPAQLTEGEWLGTAPEDLPFSAGPLPDGKVHHFLLPAGGWGAVAGAKEARALAPDQAKQLAAWRKGMKRKVSDKKTKGRKLSQLQRLQALSRRAEYLWDLVIQRLTISEREISRRIDVWGADWITQPADAIPKEKVYEDLHAPGTPYWRLKKVMDAWCALWFWPLDKAGLLDGSDAIYSVESDSPRDPSAPSSAAEQSSRLESTGFEQVFVTESLFSLGDEQLDLAEYAQAQVTTARKANPARPRKPEPARDIIPLQNLDDWLDFVEAVLGRTDVPPESLVTNFGKLADLEPYEDDLPKWMGMDSEFQLEERFLWLWDVQKITEDEGFFHWELQFAQVFASGGFDLQVGNPPWVRPRWEEAPILAEVDPWFMLAKKPSMPEIRARKESTLNDQDTHQYFTNELSSTMGAVELLGGGIVYPLLAGTQPDFYRAFMCRTWSALSLRGTIGLIHPDTHFGGVQERLLRAESYHRLRLHGNFVNAANWAFEIGRTREFGIHIYGSRGDINFDHLSQLYSAEVLPMSFDHRGVDHEIPGQKYHGDWDRRPHWKRIIHVNHELLTKWSRINGESDIEADRTTLLFPISVQEESAIEVIGNFPHRLRMQGPRISRGYDEANAKKDGLISYNVGAPASLKDTILQGTHFGISTPFNKEPNDPFRNGRDWRSWDLNKIPETVVPRTIYMRACTPETYQLAQDVWSANKDRLRRYTDYYRLAWRVMIDPKSTERSLFAALIPPGPAHIDTVNTVALDNERATVLMAGFWASLPLDYILRITGRSHLRQTEAYAMPAPNINHPLAPALILRTIRLNCLTNAFAPLWSDIYNPEWIQESWAAEWRNIEPLENVSDNWDPRSPLRTERERRAALVELDAMVSLWLGMTAGQLIAIYRSRYPILRDREAAMWFDSNGHQIAEDPYAYGYNQTKEHYQQLMAHLDPEIKAPPPTGYQPPFYKADRENEYRQAHKVFADRLRAAGYPVPGEDKDNHA